MRQRQYQVSVQTTNHQSTATSFVTHQRTHQNKPGGERRGGRQDEGKGAGVKKERVKKEEEGTGKSQPETKAGGMTMSEKSKSGGKKKKTERTR